jgi:hypothetical protein
MKTNSKMKSILGQATPDNFASGVLLSYELSDLLQAGFTVIHDAVVFSAMDQAARKTPVSSFPDLTGYECFINHLHVEDYLDGFSEDSKKLLRQSIAFALEVKKQLQFLFPERQFSLIVAYNEFGCNFRFHTVRIGESWLPADLEQFTREAIMILET